MKARVLTGNKKVSIWHRVGHSTAIVAGIPVAYMLGGLDHPDFSVFHIIVLMFAIEVVALLFAILIFRLSNDG